MRPRSIEKIFAPPPPHFVGDGFRVHNFIPGIEKLSMQRMDPIIMLDYNSKHYFAPSETPRGVGVHPHKGFETVTIAYNGSVAHHDSAGNSGIIHEGDVQWMTAASGILHKEYHEKEFSRRGGYFQMVQLWVNLPSKFKLSQPKYQAISNSSMGVFKLKDEKGYIEVIAGTYDKIKGPASTFTSINMFNAVLEAEAEAKFNFPEKYNTFILVIEGEITVNDSSTVATDHLILFANQGEEFRIKANDKSKVLILSGEPINEPISAYGPFVMNSREEIIQAYREFETGKFGYLAD